jgi:hypothetical protein
MNNSDVAKILALITALMSDFRYCPNSEIIPVVLPKISDYVSKDLEDWNYTDFITDIYCEELKSKIESRDGKNGINNRIAPSDNLKVISKNKAILVYCLEYAVGLFEREEYELLSNFFDLMHSFPGAITYKNWDKSAYYKQHFKYYTNNYDKNFRVNKKDLA